VCLHMGKTEKIKWLRWDKQANKSVKSIVEVSRSLLPKEFSANTTLVKELINKAEKGYVPDPYDLEKIALDQKNGFVLLLAALMHREFARFLAALFMSTAQYVDEMVSAYIKSVSLLLSTSIINDQKPEIVRETIRTVGELTYIANKLSAREDLQKIIITVDNIINNVIKTLELAKSGEKTDIG